MPTHINHMLKETDAGMADTRKALEAAGIRVRSLVQVHKEEVPGGGTQASGEAKKIH